MKRLMIQGVLLLALLSSSATAFAQTTASDGSDSIDKSPVVEKPTPVQRVAFLLSAIHQLPSKESFDQIPGARDILEKIALDFNALQQRAAISALAYYPSDATLKTLLYILKSPAASRGTKISVLDQIGYVYRDDRGLDLLAEYLNNDDLYIRIGAVYGLSYFNSKKAFKLMSDRYAIEKDPEVRRKLEEYGIWIN